MNSENELEPKDQRLAADLRALARPPMMVPKTVDDAVLAAARKRLRQRRRVRTAVAWATAAGAGILGISVIAASTLQLLGPPGLTELLGGVLGLLTGSTFQLLAARLITVSSTKLPLTVAERTV